MLKVLKFKNKIYQLIKHKESMKKGVIFLVIMFTPRVMVIKMSKNASFFVYFADDS